MSRVKVEAIENSIEDLILTGMIVDTKFLRLIYKAAKPEYFRSDLVKIVVRWIREYFLSNNSEAPGEELKLIFDLEQGSLDEDEAKTLRLFLKRVSDEYTGSSFNADYVLPKAFEYLEGNAYEYKITLVKRELRRGDLSKAKEIFDNARKEVFEETTTWQSISDIDFLRSWWGETQEEVMSFSGELGRYLPKIERGRLYAMIGPPKRGKSRWLLEWAYQGVIDGLKVVFFSLEMKEKEVDQRWKERISGKEITNKKNDWYTYPILDCKLNQNGECQRPENPNPDHIVCERNFKDNWEDHPDYKVCTACKGSNLFEPTYWMKKEKIKRLTLQEAEKVQKSIDMHVKGDNLRIKYFPLTSATVDDLERALNDLEIGDQFIPDMIIVDYADILKEDLRLGDKRHRVGDNWQQLSRMAKVRNVVLVTASQGNRQSFKKNRIDADDVSEDFSKIMTIDAGFAINEENFDKESPEQTDKFWQVQRIETVILRYGKYVPGLQCVTFNDMARGQLVIDSYITWHGA